MQNDASSIKVIPKLSFRDGVYYETCDHLLVECKQCIYLW